ncbi:cation:proton antiporter [Pseudoroseicyclus aestuarii]|uniref:Sodium/proton antiporter (CPA1 family) n=1 Tax=Pseudoroseicyclus aestuarii TaxID=1795041 RepID=A0A318STY9_9RHOB|nr:sodium:proton antiporter [Pseudoroseicyclus aestuarii]PYE83839.1 sodium/proton antiporter (CPA1 family) [Pseudoroseicyclus aestuarii]
MTLLQLASLLIVLSGAFGALNYFFLKLPQSIGILVVTLAASIAVFVLDLAFPGLGLVDAAKEAVEELEFSDALLEGMLGFLLFAGALHVSLDDLKQEAAIVLLMATLGVALSTAVVGFGMSFLTPLPLLVALVFGALISPTDPVAVLGILRSANIRKSLETKIAGESLFNDGVGYVAWLILVAFAFPGADSHAAPGLLGIGELFLREAVGGAVLGAVLGWGTFQVMKRIDDYSLEVLLTLGLAFGGYELAIALEVSGPIQAVVSGLFIGHVGMRDGMSEITREYVDGFWSLVDEILNAVLFLMIGFEVFAVDFDPHWIWIVALGLGLALLGRFIAVLVPVVLLRPFARQERDVVPMMTWGGIKGGISIALALALPESEWKDMILAVTFTVVVFSVLVQGLTVARFARRLKQRWG